jgi:hypothetical protein
MNQTLGFCVKGSHPGCFGKTGVLKAEPIEKKPGFEEETRLKNGLKARICRLRSQIRASYSNEGIIFIPPA